ncbi:hypothetical protein FisN_14Lh239 [Fistulifera solaris]|uniref:Trigger factor ribosome-binding bacterial domain-containing protein n=1 Tax=Fistulifera solaris TaxID=1519565 RepID=A0A1Z5J9P4_FISSO|nr:hypothetical protein FisN_14Lh239 [Fistulifera solaris]|eukprot:GAX10723.1 hypothetical protein FisN_14Lh239 [Fistulifera solaris]
MKLPTYFFVAVSLFIPAQGFTQQTVLQRYYSKCNFEKGTFGIRNHVYLCAEEWTGDVVAGGAIQGCSIQLVDGSMTEWIVTIDGVEADLGRFSQAIYKKITTDAKQQRFQGFRPGTIPPHLEPTYRAFTMDECARETVLEALQQNNIRPFESSRGEMNIECISFPPPAPKRSKKSKKKASTDAQADEEEEVAAEWLTKKSMKEAVDAGWQPGQSFSFVATGVKGQKLKDQDAATAMPLGANY